MEERTLGKLEATLGLSLLAALLLALGGAYIYQLDSPVPVVPPDPNWRSAHVAPANEGPVQQTAYRPEWLSSQGDEQAPLAR